MRNGSIDHAHCHDCACAMYLVQPIVRNVSIDHAQCDDCACAIDFLIPQYFGLQNYHSWKFFLSL